MVKICEDKLSIHCSYSLISSVSVDICMCRVHFVIYFGCAFSRVIKYGV